MVNLLLQWPVKTVTHLIYRCNRFLVATNTKPSATYILNRRVVILGVLLHSQRPDLTGRLTGPGSQAGQGRRENAFEHTSKLAESTKFFTKICPRH